MRKEVERLVALTNVGELIYPDKCSRELVNFYNSGFTTTENVIADFDMTARVRKLEIDLINRAMKKSGGNKTKAAGLLNITRQGLLKKMKRYGVGN